MHFMFCSSLFYLTLTGKAEVNTEEQIIYLSELEFHTLICKMSNFVCTYVESDLEG